MLVEHAWSLASKSSVHWLRLNVVHDRCVASQQRAHSSSSWQIFACSAMHTMHKVPLQDSQLTNAGSWKQSMHSDLGLCKLPPACTATQQCWHSFCASAGHFLQILIARCFLQCWHKIAEGMMTTARWRFNYQASCWRRPLSAMYKLAAHEQGACSQSRERNIGTWRMLGEYGNTSSKYGLGTGAPRLCTSSDALDEKTQVVGLPDILQYAPSSSQSERGIVACSVASMLA